MDYPIKVPKSVINHWNNSAKYCYSRGAVCRGCEYYEVLSTECRMKEAVIELVKKFGAPRGVVVEQIRE